MKFSEEREDADYRHEQVFTRDDAERACTQAAKFVAMAKTVPVMANKGASTR